MYKSLTMYHTSILSQFLQMSASNNSVDMETASNAVTGVSGVEEVQAALSFLFISSLGPWSDIITHDDTSSSLHENIYIRDSVIIIVVIIFVSVF